MISVTVRPLFAESLITAQTRQRQRAPVILDELVVGQEHRDQARIRSTLYVVLTAQRDADPRRDDRPGRSSKQG